MATAAPTGLPRRSVSELALEDAEAAVANARKAICDALVEIEPGTSLAKLAGPAERRRMARRALLEALECLACCDGNHGDLRRALRG